jgi:hypothetical protein
MAVNPIMSGGRPPVDAFNAGVSGIRSGMRGVDGAAQEIAELNVREPDGGLRPDYLESATEALVDLKIYQRNVEAATKVVKTADEMVGFLLDIRA